MCYLCWAVKRQLDTTSMTEISYLSQRQKQLDWVRNDNEYRHKLRDDHDIRNAAESDNYSVKNEYKLRDDHNIRDAAESDNYAVRSTKILKRHW